MTSPFEKYLGTEYAPELLAIIPPDALLSPRSTVDPKQRGKVPGSYNAVTGTWSGRSDCLKGIASEGMIRKWSTYPDPNVGLRTKYFPGIDFDIDLESLIQALLPIAREHLGPSPVRGRDGSPRVMLLYRLADGGEPVRSFCLKFTLPEAGSTQHAIEILGNDHSMVLEGRHPKGGHYKWRNEVGPVDYGPENLTPVTTENLRGFVAALKEKLAAMGATIVSGKSGVVGSSASGGARREIGDPVLMAMNLDTLRKALELIPCEEIYQRSEWLKLMIAAKAGSGGDEGFLEKVVLPWSLRYQENTVDYVKKTWNSICEAELGDEYIFQIAREYEPTFLDDIQEIFADTLLPNASTDTALSEQAPRGGEYRGPVPKLMPADFALHTLPRRPFVLGNRFMAGAVSLWCRAAWCWQIDLLDPYSVVDRRRPPSY